MTTAPELDVLKPSQVARLFKVNEKSALRWLHDGRLAGWRTPGGHWRASASVVRDALVEGGVSPDEAAEMVAAVLRRQAGGS